MREFRETLYPTWGQFFSIDEVLFEQKTDHQHLIIFHNKEFGRVIGFLFEQHFHHCLTSHAKYQNRRYRSHIGKDIGLL